MFPVILAICGYISWRLWFLANHVTEYSWFQLFFDVAFIVILVVYGRKLNASKPQNRD